VPLIQNEQRIVVANAPVGSNIPQSFDGNPIQLLTEAPRNAEEVVSKVAACGTVVNYLVENHNQIKSDVEARFARMESVLVQEARAHSDVVTEVKRDAQQLQTLESRLKEMELMSMAHQQAGSQGQVLSEGLVEEITKLTDRVDNLQSVGMQQAGALNSDLKSFENQLLARLNLPQVSAEQSELASRINDNSGQISSLRAMLERESVARMQVDDQGKEFDRMFKQALAEREGVLREQFDQRFAVLQSKVDKERAEMLREVSKARDQSAESSRNTQDVESRERGRIEERMAELEANLAEERKMRHTTADMMQDSVEGRLRAMERAVSEETKQRQEKELATQQAFKHTRGDVEEARKAFEDIMRAEVRARLQGLEQAENKLEWCISREDATLRTMRNEMQSNMSTIEARVKKSEHFFLEQIEQTRSAINESAKEVSLRAAKGYSAIEAVVNNLTQRLNTTIEKLDHVQRDATIDADRRQRQLRDEIGDASRVMESHCDTAVSRCQAELESTRRVVDEELRPGIGDLREINKALTLGMEGINIRIVEAVGELKMSMQRQRDIAHEDALQITSALEHRVEHTRVKVNDIAMEQSRVNDSARKMEESTERLRQVQGQIQNDARVRVEVGLKSAVETVVNRCNTQLRQMQELLEVKLDAANEGIMRKMELTTCPHRHDGMADNKDEITVHAQHDADRDKRNSCQMDFDRLRKQFQRLHLKSWSHEDPEAMLSDPMEGNHLSKESALTGKQLEEDFEDFLQLFPEAPASPRAVKDREIVDMIPVDEDLLSPRTLEPEEAIDLGSDAEDDDDEETAYPDTARTEQTEGPLTDRMLGNIERRAAEQDRERLEGVTESELDSGYGAGGSGDDVDADRSGPVGAESSAAGLEDAEDADEEAAAEEEVQVVEGEDAPAEEEAAPAEEAKVFEPSEEAGAGGEPAAAVDDEPPFDPDEPEEVYGEGAPDEAAAEEAEAHAQREKEKAAAMEAGASGTGGSETGAHDPAAAAVEELPGGVTEGVLAQLQGELRRGVAQGGEGDTVAEPGSGTGTGTGAEEPAPADVAEAAAETQAAAEPEIAPEAAPAAEEVTAGDAPQVVDPEGEEAAEVVSVEPAANAGDGADDTAPVDTI